MLSVRLAIRVVLVVLLLLPTAETGAADQQQCDGLDVQVSNDACASMLAVSVFGDASGNGHCTAGPVQCVAVSGTGDAYGGDPHRNCASGLTGGRAVVQCVAISLTGNATAPPTSSCGHQAVACIAVSGTGNATAGTDRGPGQCRDGIVTCVAISPMGTAQAGPGTWCPAPSCSSLDSGSADDPPEVHLLCIASQLCPSNGCASVSIQVDDDACASSLAVSGLGNARSDDRYCGTALSCVAVAGGDATGCQGQHTTALGPTGASCIAISLTGDARNDAGWCTGAGCMAASGTGNAENHATCNTAAGCLAASGTGDAENHAPSCGPTPCIATSGTGNASNSPVQCSQGCAAASATGNAGNHHSAGCTDAQRPCIVAAPMGDDTSTGGDPCDAPGCLSTADSPSDHANHIVCVEGLLDCVPTDCSMVTAAWHDACGSVLVASIHGNATSSPDCSGCNAVSGFGNASVRPDTGWCGAASCLAISGTGDSRVDARDCGPVASCIAASGTGNASMYRTHECYRGDPNPPSTTPPAPPEPTCGIYCRSVAASCMTATGFGTANQDGGLCSTGRGVPLLSAASCVSLAAFGDADSSWEQCSSGIMCLALSIGGQGTGEYDECDWTTIGCTSADLRSAP